MSSAADILRVARSQIGIKESPYGSNNIKYNTEYYNRRVYGSGYAWCATFVWWVFKHAGCPELYYGGKKSAFCPTIADYYILHKQAVSKNKGMPGDIIMFDWNHDRSSDHIGIIEKRNSNGTYTTIEGNTSIGNNGNGGMVMRRIRRSWEISWIFRPRYTENKPIPDHEDRRPFLLIDGDWGKSTTKKAQEFLKTTRDGIVSGQLTSCKKYLPAANTSSWTFVKVSMRGSEMIKALQKFLSKYYKIKIDGKMGKSTVIALQKFLSKYNWYKDAIDGIMGKGTVKAWQRYLTYKLNKKK